jgi:hypothetical protein
LVAVGEQAIVTIEIILLALASSIRPTSLAAVYAVLSTDEPRRLMIAYIVAGLAFTIAFGLLVIGVAGGVDMNAGSSETKAVAEVLAGAIVLGFAFAVRTGRIGGPRADDAPPRARGRFDKLLKHRMTFRTAALAGPVTHVPGIFYLIALNLIVTDQPSVARGFVEVVIYNVIWFALPIAALAVCIVAPDAARDVVGTIQAWAKEHARQIMLAVAFVVGTALVVRGLLTF